MPSFPFPFFPHFILSSVLRSYDDRERPKSIFPSVKNCICVAVSGKSVVPCRRGCHVCHYAVSLRVPSVPRACRAGPSLGPLRAREGAELSDVNPKSVQPFPIDNGLPGTQAALPIDCETPTARDGTSGREVNSYVPIPPLATCSLSNSYVSQSLKTKTFARAVFNFKNIPPRLNSLRWDCN